MSAARRNSSQLCAPCSIAPPLPTPPPPLAAAGLWATLQFKFIQLQYPGVVMAFEKMLVAGCMPAAAAVQTWGFVSGVGMSNSSFFLAALLCALYHLIALPLPSSFHLAQRRSAVGGAGTKAPPLQDAADGATCFVLAVALPVGVYAATHAAVLFQWVHLWSMLLLTCGPLLYITALPGEGEEGGREGRWWWCSGGARPLARQQRALTRTTPAPCRRAVVDGARARRRRGPPPAAATGAGRFLGGAGGEGGVLQPAPVHQALGEAHVPPLLSCPKMHCVRMVLWQSPPALRAWRGQG